MDRMANITGIPEVNQEHLQLLRYEVGQYYQTHNDYIPYQVRKTTRDSICRHGGTAHTLAIAILN
jgi:Rps23 Pro-64 3,4-dihydroxylase Tpa1-like proline 4-hydroxylase